MALTEAQKEKMYQEAFQRGVQRGLQLMKERLGVNQVEVPSEGSPSSSPAQILHDCCTSATEGSVWEVEDVHGLGDASKYSKFNATLSLDLEEVRAAISQYGSEDFGEYAHYTPYEVHRPVDKMSYLKCDITMIGKGGDVPAITARAYYVSPRGSEAVVDETEPVIRLKATPESFNVGVVERLNEMVLGSADENNLGLEEAGLDGSILENFLLSEV